MHAQIHMQNTHTQFKNNNNKILSVITQSGTHNTECPSYPFLLDHFSSLFSLSFQLKFLLSLTNWVPTRFCQSAAGFFNQQGAHWALLTVSMFVEAPGILLDSAFLRNGYV